MPDTPGTIIITDFSRGWDPTHPDEQLIGSEGAPGDQFYKPQGAPFLSPDVHDVDFWNGYLSKRNGKVALGSPISAGNAVLGLFSYFFTSIAGSINRTLSAFCNGLFYYYNLGVWTSILLNNGDSGDWTQATFAYFETLKNLLFMSPGNSNGSTTLLPARWWDGASIYMPFHGGRPTPFYERGLLNGAQWGQISVISGTSITFVSDVKASGLFRGKQVWLHYASGTVEPVAVSSFVTTGTVGSSTYYVTSMIITTPPKYTAEVANAVVWGAVVVSGLATGGSIAISGTLTTIRVLAVTTLLSGGQRSWEISVDLPVGTTGSIALSSLQMSYGSFYFFGTDIPENATTWYMTVPFDPQLSNSDPNGGLSQIFYRIPDNKGVPTDTSTGYNPMPNSTTAFNILTGRNVNTDVTLVADQAVDAQGYFTGQVDVPYYKFAKAWQDFLVLFGDVWNPSSIWISAFGAPQVFGTQGGLDGAFIEIPNGNDGQVIIGAYVWRGDMYIFKTNSVYVLTFSGSTSLSPFNVTKLQGNYGPISAKSIAEGDNYLYFLSPLGLCAISGLTISLLPESDKIKAKFMGPDSWDLSIMTVSQAIAYPGKKQIHFQVSTQVPVQGQTYELQAGDNMLVYDWERRTFWYNTGSVQETAFTQDLGASPPVAYAGDSAGQVWTLDQSGTDEVTPIDFHYETPWLNMGTPGNFKMLTWIHIGGIQQSAGTLNVTLSMDFHLKQDVIYTMDMTNPQFQRGLYISVNQQAKYFKITLTNNTENIPVSIRFMRIDYNDLGTQL